MMLCGVELPDEATWRTCNPAQTESSEGCAGASWVPSGISAQGGPVYDKAGSHNCQIGETWASNCGWWAGE